MADYFQQVSFLVELPSPEIAAEVVARFEQFSGELAVDDGQTVALPEGLQAFTEDWFCSWLSMSADGSGGRVLVPNAHHRARIAGSERAAPIDAAAPSCSWRRANAAAKQVKAG